VGIRARGCGRQHTKPSSQFLLGICTCAYRVERGLERNGGKKTGPGHVTEGEREKVDLSVREKEEEGPVDLLSIPPVCFIRVRFRSYNRPKSSADSFLPPSTVIPKRKVPLLCMPRDTVCDARKKKEKSGKGKTPSLSQSTSKKRAKREERKESTGVKLAVHANVPMIKPVTFLLDRRDTHSNATAPTRSRTQQPAPPPRHRCSRAVLRGLFDGWRALLSRAEVRW
jgi:hypothetical protein